MTSDRKKSEINMAYLKEATRVNSMTFMLLGVLNRCVRLHEKCNNLLYTFFVSLSNYVIKSYFIFIGLCRKPIFSRAELSLRKLSSESQGLLITCII